MSDYDFWKDLDKIFEAIVAYQEKTIEFNKQFINPWVKLGNVFEKKEGNGAIAARKNAVEIAPENAQNWFELANAYTQSGSFDQAIQAYQKARDLGVKSGELYKNLGMAYALASRYQEAIPALRQALERAEDEKEKANIWNHLGNMYRKLNNYQMAFQAFQEADQIEGVMTSDMEEYFSLASSKGPSSSSHNKDDDPYFDQATKTVSPLAKSIPGKEQEEDIENKKSDVVKDDLPVILEMDFTTLEDYLEAENARVKDTAQKGAVAGHWHEQEMLTTGREPPTESQLAAEKEVDTDAVEKNRFAFSAYEEFLQDTIALSRQNPNENPFEEEETVVTSYRKADGTTHSEVNELESSGNPSIDVETKNAQIWNELGNVYFNAGALDDSIAAYVKSIELDVLFAWPYTNLAMAYVQKGRYEEAVLLYQRGIELFSEEKDKAIAWNHLGDLYRRIEDYEKAIMAYQRADDLDPGNLALTNQSKLSLLGSEKIFHEVNSPL